MNIFNKAFEAITFDDVAKLVTDGIPEGQHLEYKQQCWGRGDEDIREMLRDISSMANAYGGYFVIGMKENPDSGVAESIMSISNAETERDRIYSSCLASIQPRIPSLNIRTLKDRANEIILLYVPKSLRSPHMVGFKGLNQFWVRHDRQKTPMSTEEIRDAFSKSMKLTDDARSFINERRAEANEEVGSAPSFWISAMPIGALNDEFIDIKSTELREKLKNPPNFRRGGWNFSFMDYRPRPSFYGLKIENRDGTRSVELHRNGYLEGKYGIVPRLIAPTMSGESSGGTPNYKNVIRGVGLLELIHNFLGQAEQINDFLGYGGEFLVNVAFFNTKGYGLRKYREEAMGYWDELSIWKNKRNLEFPSFVFESLDPDKIGKEISDRIWQAFGFEQEPYYIDGKLNLRQ